MKKPLLFGIILTVCIIIVAFVFSLGYPGGMISYWKFETGSGPTAFDSVDANDGTLVNWPIWTTTGQVGGALSFDGVDDYVSIGNMGSFPAKGTIEFWMKADAVQNYRNPFTTNYIGGNAGIRFEEHSSHSGYTNAFYAVVGNDAGNYGGHVFRYTASEPPYNNPMQANTWYHVALVWDTTANNVKGYWDGVKAFDASHNAWPTEMQDVAIGNGYSTDRYWDGLVDEVAIYNRALSVEEIQQHYQDGLIGLGYEVECVSPPPDLVSWWPGDENAEDFVDGNHGTLENGATYAAGKIDQAFSFDGVDDYVDVGDIGVTGDWTIDFWTKLYTVAPRIQYPIGLSTRIFPHSGSGVFMAFTDESNTWGLYDGN
ncbi:MAG: hypothetical protein KAV40_05230, partial [Thermoplasmatales archaeon]|nr:hypothetical protein [Thermoplasmatales archaeon]